MIKKPLLPIIGLIWVMFFSPVLEAQELARNTLQGLDAMYLMVDALAPENEPLGVDRNELVRQMSAKLNSVGIRILSRTGWETTHDKPVLYINVSTVKTGLAHYVYSMNVQFFQMVSLVRDPTIQKLAMTWRTQGYLGSVYKKRLSETIYSGMTEIMDEFIADYLSVNPERAKTASPNPN